jgi:hypothetical protein
MSTQPKRPKTLSRLQQLITEWERDSGQPVRRLNLRVASMMLAGALARAVGEDGTAVFITRGGIAMELRMGEKARVTRDVDLVLRGDPDSLLGHLDTAFAEDYEEFAFERDEPRPLQLRPHVYRTRVKTSFRTKPFMTIVLEIAPVEAGGDEVEVLPAHDLSKIGMDGPQLIPVLAVRWQIAQKLHALTEPPLRSGGENPRYWDLIDLQLLHAIVGEDLAPVKDACQRIFASRHQQPWPPSITLYPSWPELYATIANGLDMPITDVNEAAKIVQELIQHIDLA